MTWSPPLNQTAVASAIGRAKPGSSAFSRERVWSSTSDAGPYFLYLGRMAPEKGARQAVEAARRSGHRLILAAKMREQAEREFFASQVEPLLTDR